MAESQGVINRARNGAGEIKSLADNIKLASDQLNSALKQNGNYQYFKIGTDKGLSVDADLNQTVDTIVNMLAPQLNNVAGAIESFCVRQEELNRQEEYRRKQEEEAAKGNP